jgi:hypothetical protein
MSRFPEKYKQPVQKSPDSSESSWSRPNTPPKNRPKTADPKNRTKVIPNDINVEDLEEDYSSNFGSNGNYSNAFSKVESISSFESVSSFGEHEKVPLVDCRLGQEDGIVGGVEERS